ncbi:MAG: hypothetical protein IT373_04185 [Polyangiaceae bacterium]|nr:hypothetical protein [Polyangiaceae bacterium]
MPSSHPSAWFALASLTALSACGNREVQAPPPSASVPSFVRTGAEPATAVAPPPAPTVATASTAEPDPTTPAVATAGGDDGDTVPASDATEPDASAAPAAPVPLPDVEVKNFGLHIGGGPNDAAAHAPIREALKAHRDAFRACYAKADAAKPGTTFGLDLLIPGAGGVAALSKPRSDIKSAAYLECMLAAFAKIEWKRPPKGQAQKVSYSLRFEKKK